MKQRKLNDSTVSKTLPVIPTPDPGKAVEVFVSVVVALVVAFADDVTAVAD